MLLFAWGSRVGGEKIGWWAAIMFTVCLQTYIHARAAVADMLLVMFMTAAILGWLTSCCAIALTTASQRVEHPTSSCSTVSHRRWWWIFYLSLAFAFLAKGPVGWLPLLAVALDAVCCAATPQLNRRFLFFTGVL